MSDDRTSFDFWTSFHVYYHENLDRLVQELLPSIVASHLDMGSIDQFFFVRYSLGGHHLRLRMRALPGRREQVIELTRQAAMEFMARVPSQRSLTGDVIQRINRSLIAADAHETDYEVYPDNSFFIFPFCPEIQRYGGPDLLPQSLDLFAISSAVALSTLIQNAGRPRSVKLVAVFCLLLQQAMGFARTEEELLNLVGYGVGTWGTLYPQVVEKASAVFLARRDMFLDLLSTELEHGLEALASEESPARHFPFLLGCGSRRLSQALDRQEEAVRNSIGVSQLHMTANRLGLTNGEEVYLGRLIVLILEEIISSESEERARLTALLASTAKPSAVLLSMAHTLMGMASGASCDSDQ